MHLFAYAADGAGGGVLPDAALGNPLGSVADSDIIPLDSGKKMKLDIKRSSDTKS